MATLDELKEQIAALGDTDEVVAERLRAAGVHGTRGMSEHCPVANYLRLLGYTDADVDICYVQADDLYLSDSDLGDGVPAFVTAFDCGAYDDLAQGFHDDATGVYYDADGDVRL